MPVLGAEAVVVEMGGNFRDGMSGRQVADAVLLGVICQLPTHSLYIKMTGPAVEVQAEREHFLAFCKSLKVKS